MHLITHHVAQRIIEVTVSGFWDDDHFDAFVADLREAIASFPPGDTPPATLYDYTHAAIQTQSVVGKMRALAQHPSMVDRTVAMYTDGVLARQQAKRVAEGRDNMRVFDSRAAALDFLGARPAADARPRLYFPRLATLETDKSHKFVTASGSITHIKVEPDQSRKLG